MSEQAVAVRDTSQGVVLPVPVAEAVRQWQEYQELTKKLLDESDYQAGPGKKFKKKSAWRKYARAFNLSDHVTYEHIERDGAGRPVYARVRVQVTATNGRTAEADHECHLTEKCCPAAFGELCEKADWDAHTCCVAGCSGWRHWSHPGDIPATATTRAKNRAISDMIGAGEVSAEEMDGAAAPPAAKICPVCGKAAIIKGKAEYGGGWLCFKKKGGCGWKAPETYDWTKPKIEPETAGTPPESPPAPHNRQADAAEGTASVPAVSSPPDAETIAWAQVREAREALGWSTDQVRELIARLWPSTKGHHGGLTLGQVQTLLDQLRVILLPQAEREMGEEG